MAPNVKDKKEGIAEWEEGEGEESPILLPKKEVLYNGYFYDVSNFIDKHPGGFLIEYYTQAGEDATIPMLQFHNRGQDRVDKYLKALPRRKAQEHETNFGGDKASRDRYARMSADFLALHREVEAEGLFKPVYFRNLLVLLEVTLVMGLGGWISYTHQDYLPLRIVGALIFGLGMGRMGLLQHECGHNSVSGNPSRDKMFQNICYGLYMGMSARWWVRRHNRHHAMPQRYQRDFDLEHLPVTATHQDFVTDPDNLTMNNVLTRNQGFLLPLNGTLFICAINFYYHPHYIIKRGLWNEALALGAHFFIAYHTLGVWPYLLAKSFMSLYLSSSFALNHTHLPLTYEHKHWVEFGFLHTANISPGLFNDWWLILLNYQIEHHLFPTMPQYNLRYVRDRVMALAKKYDLPYETTSLPHAYAKIFKHVFEVQNHVRQVHKNATATKKTE